MYVQAIGCCFRHYFAQELDMSTDRTKEDREEVDREGKMAELMPDEAVATKRKHRSAKSETAQRRPRPASRNEIIPSRSKNTRKAK